MKNEFNQVIRAQRRTTQIIVKETHTPLLKIDTRMLVDEDEEPDYFEKKKKKQKEKLITHKHTRETDVYCHILHNLYKNVFDM